MDRPEQLQLAYAWHRTKAMKKLKVGIVGYGVVGRRRRAFIDANPSFRTVAVSDIKFSRRQQGNDDVEYHRDFRQLLKSDLDVAFVSLPNNLAAEATKTALKRGMHVFVKSPGKGCGGYSRCSPGRKGLPRPQAEVWVQPPVPWIFHRSCEDCSLTGIWRPAECQGCMVKAASFRSQVDGDLSGSLQAAESFSIKVSTCWIWFGSDRRF